MKRQEFKRERIKGKRKGIVNQHDLSDRFGRSYLCLLRERKPKRSYGQVLSSRFLMLLQIPVLFSSLLFSLF